MNGHRSHIDPFSQALMLVKDYKHLCDLVQSHVIGPCILMLQKSLANKRLLVGVRLYLEQRRQEEDCTLWEVEQLP